MLSVRKSFAPSALTQGNLSPSGSNCQCLGIKIFLCGLLGGARVVVPFDKFAFLELGAGTDERHEMGCVDRAPS